MAYMDLAPAKPNGRTVVMFHGKNFCSASWDSLLDRLRDAGFGGSRRRPDRLLQIDEAESITCSPFSSSRPTPMPCWRRWGSPR